MYLSRANEGTISFFKKSLPTFTMSQNKQTNYFDGAFTVVLGQEWARNRYHFVRSENRNHFRNSFPASRRTWWKASACIRNASLSATTNDGKYCAVAQRHSLTLDTVIASDAHSGPPEDRRRAPSNVNCTSTEHLWDARANDRRLNVKTVLKLNALQFYGQQIELV